ncbi:heat shock protein HspQ [Rhodospirillaceae bacterium KN72]|uniref:Heat shock protein HspQ n=1 Tax=Pacificispira spongiicola TaxID=2729598 RepID=A0A7Y0E269_9PROT|nr:heat shock protein HspQ [Pacificispira spongiicola]NMM45882.1 heat shock protein HspQ [Pacificispira spongiicola]
MREKDELSGQEGHATSPPPTGAGGNSDAVDKGQARFSIGQSVQHRKFGFRGVIFDVDPVFANTEEWYNAIPAEVRPRKDQPFYHLFAVNPADQSPYVAYVSEQNLVPIEDGEDVVHPQLEEYFEGRDGDFWVVPRDRVN